MWKRLRRLLLRWQAPQPCPAHPAGGLTRPDSGASTGTPNLTLDPTPNPTLDSTHAARVPPPRPSAASPLVEPLRGASRPQKPRATGPPWGRGASALDPSVSRTAVREPPSAAIDESAVRLPHGALAISAHLSVRRHLRWRSNYNRPRSSTDGASSAVGSERRLLRRTDRHTSSRSCEIRTCSSCSPCCDEPFVIYGQVGPSPSRSRPATRPPLI